MTDLQDLGHEIGCPPGIKTADYIRHIAKEHKRLSSPTITEEMVEAAALAIYWHGSIGQPWEKYPVAGKQRIRDAAQDAILAALLSRKEDRA